MQFLTFYDKAALKLGIRQSDRVIDILEVTNKMNITDLPDTPQAFYQRGAESVDLLKRVRQQPQELIDSCSKEEDGLRLGPCIPNPGKIVCVGLNYRRHAIEAGMSIPIEPILFSKYNNTIAAHNHTILLPHIAEHYDYEVELGFVIGKQGKDISVEEALDYVMGYCNVNDVSARDLQLRTGQWLIGKTLDDFLPVGPYLVTADEVSDPQDLSIKCWRNDQLVQDSSTADMIFTVAEIIAHISQIMTLEPGDLITTGTPEGVIFGMKDPKWLTDGDEVSVAVEGLGVLSNSFAKPI